MQRFNVGDVVSFGYCSSFSITPCFAVMVTKKLFDKFADVYMKECFDIHKRMNIGHRPIFLLRVNNSVNEFGCQILSLSFAFPSSSNYTVKFLYSIFDDKERSFAEKMFQSFDDVFAVEPNRNVSIYCKVFETLKKITKDVEREHFINSGEMCDEFKKLLIIRSQKKGVGYGKRK